MKQCKKCLEFKSISDFYYVGHTRKDGSKGTVNECKVCCRLYRRNRKEVNRIQMKEWRSNNIEQNRKLNTKSRNSNFIKNKNIVQRLKENPCIDCRLVFPLVAMDFDHRDNTQKLFQVSNSLRSRSTKTILNEISKCDLVCSNCHRLRTNNRKIRKEKTSKYTRRYEFLKTWVESFKTDPCFICSKQFKPCQMDFDHLDPGTKADSVCNLVAKRTTQKRILEEIQKCRLLCSNCHRIWTAQQRSDQNAH